MAERSWYVAVDGKPAGPYPEQQFLGFIANGQVDRNALVWSEGMAAWQRAGYVPGLFAPPQSAPPPVAPPTFDQGQSRSIAPRSETLPTQMQGADDPGNRVEADFGALSLFGRSFLYSIGMALIVTAPWAATSFYRWIVARIRVPGRPNLAFAGKAGDIWWAFILIPVSNFVPAVGFLISIYFSLFAFKWAVRNISSEGRLLPLSFTGGYLPYLGWNLFLALSTITIIGWAWVAAAWMRWTCRNIAGSTRVISFNGTGWQILWRTWVLTLVCSLIIPIPWMMRWYARWYVSQIAVG
jgi:hypothetical protein